MLGFGKRDGAKGDGAEGVARVSARLCTDRFNGKYPLVGLYDCSQRKVWVAKPLSGQAIRISHAALITGVDNATSTVWKDRFLCFWFYTPRTGEGYIHGYPIDWEEAHLLVRIDRQWDYDRQRMIPPELQDQIDENLERQVRHSERIWEFFKRFSGAYPMNLHLIGQRATDSQFYVKRHEVQGK
ncbi:MAG: hypothetical protein ABSB42_08855 [Tepidisphaeraceae bacterium]|jgi:hypothetical protein